MDQSHSYDNVEWYNRDEETDIGDLQSLCYAPVIALAFIFLSSLSVKVWAANLHRPPTKTISFQQWSICSTRAVSVCRLIKRRRGTNNFVIKARNL